MKIDATSLNSNNHGVQKKPSILLPLEEDMDAYLLDKSIATSWELSTNPGAAGNPAKYKYQARILQGDESPRVMIRWLNDLQKIAVGLNVTDYDTIKPIYEACMRQGPLGQFNAALNALKQNGYDSALAAALATDQAAGNNNASQAVINNGVGHYADVPHLKMALQYVVTENLPRKILAKVKRSLRRDMRKPKDMKIRCYFQNITRINTVEIPNLPPYGANQSLSLLMS